MKTILFARVSSREQEETGYSLSAQEKLLKEYAERKNFSVAKVFSISESASGRYQRETFNKMLEHTKKKNIKIIICEKTDRITRNFKDAVLINDWINADEERQVHLVKDSLILHKNSRSQEKLNWNIRIVFAQNYIDNLSEEVKKGQIEKIRQGWLPTKPPLGYKTIGEQGHKIHIVDEKVASFIKKMFELYASGEYSLKRLVQVIHKEGLRTRDGNKLVKSRLADLLSNPFYCGEIRWKEEIYKGEQKPLISKELFEQVQEILQRKTTPKYRKHFPLFKSLIRCKECGGLITWEKQKEYWYGHCNHYRSCSQRKYIRQEEVEKQLIPYLDNISISKRLLRWLKKVIKESHKDEIEYNAKAREELNRQYKRIQQRLDRLYDDKIDEAIDSGFYERKFQQYTSEKEEVLESLSRHNTANDKYYELGISILDLAHKGREVYSKASLEQKRSLLGIVFSNPHLDNGKLFISYTKPFEIISKVILEEKTKNNIFEPSKNLINKRKTGQNMPRMVTQLRGQDSNL